MNAARRAEEASDRAKVGERSRQGGGADARRDGSPTDARVLASPRRAEAADGEGRASAPRLGILGAGGWLRDRCVPRAGIGFANARCAVEGVVAAGHPLTAEAGAEALRAGGNAVDAAVAAVLMSFVSESPLTGPGAGGFMLVHTAGGEDHLLDFFVAAPGHGDGEREPADLTPIDVTFAEGAVQQFNVGPSSSAPTARPVGLAQALERFGTLPLARPHRRAGARGPRRASRSCPMQGFLFRVLEPIFRSTARVRGHLRARAAGCSRRGTRSGCPSWATCSSAWARRGPASSTRATWPRP